MKSNPSLYGTLQRKSTLDEHARGRKEVHDMREEVENVLNTRIRPALQMDGGDVELIDVNEETGHVKVALRGACAHCPYSTMTSLNVVERQLKELVPGVTEVETVA